MSTTLPLFEQPQPEIKTRLQRKRALLSSESLFIGTGSWKYDGWLDQIYTRERYFSRGRFSQKKFASECLAEFAETVPVVCGDFSFYQFLTPNFWRRLFSSVPAGLKFAFKVPEKITVRVFLSHARYGGRAASENFNFLNAGQCADAVCLFSPYQSAREPNHEVREALRDLLIRAKHRAELAYIFVNNRLEGNAPGSIEALVDSL